MHFRKVLSREMVPKLIDSLMEPFIGLANIFEVPVANHCSKHWEYNSDK